MATCFLVCEFTDLLHPELLSIGLVELAGAEHYRRTDLDTEIGKARMRASSQFVRWSGVLDPWRLVEGATATQWEMGRRTGDWPLQLANMSGTRVEVCYDYDLDFEAMAHAARDSSPWDKVRDVVLPTNINRLTGAINGELAVEECFRGLATRGLRRHHASGRCRCPVGGVRGGQEQCDGVGPFRAHGRLSATVQCGRRD
jgi:hypothetical protein